MNTPVEVLSRRTRLAQLLPWLLLWVAAPAPLWLALGMAWYFAR